MAMCEREMTWWDRFRCWLDLHDELEHYRYGKRRVYSCRRCGKHLATFGLCHVGNKGEPFPWTLVGDTKVLDCDEIDEHVQALKNQKKADRKRVKTDKKNMKNCKYFKH